MIFGKKVCFCCLVLGGCEIVVIFVGVGLRISVEVEVVNSVVWNYYLVLGCGDCLGFY